MLLYFMKFVLRPTLKSLYMHIGSKAIDVLWIFLPFYFYFSIQLSLYLGIDFIDDLIVDPRNLEWMREANCPIVSTYPFQPSISFELIHCCCSSHVLVALYKLHNYRFSGHTCSLLVSLSCQFVYALYH